MTPIYGPSGSNAVPLWRWSSANGLFGGDRQPQYQWVAKLHTELLQRDVLADLYAIYPERFNNKTNGITLRRWVQLANEPLSELLDQQIGSGWRRLPAN
ncbi:hypothetical protein FET70_03076 (plasmid) [Lactiplantibacillus plantarum]|nr:hypothetical protein FET70_03076 [Lactiplantibacillus plantarum]